MADRKNRLPALWPMFPFAKPSASNFHVFRVVWEQFTDGVAFPDPGETIDHETWHGERVTIVRLYRPTTAVIATMRQLLPDSDPSRKAWMQARSVAWLRVSAKLIEAGFKRRAYANASVLELLAMMGAKRTRRKQSNPRATKKEIVKASRQQHALTTLVANPSLTITELARTIGVGRATLYKPQWKQVRYALEVRREANKANVPRGRKLRNGDIEAIDGGRDE